MHDAVVFYPCNAHLGQRTHESAMQREVAKTAAAIKGCAFLGEHDAWSRAARRLYFVPSDTLVGIDAARQLGIHSEQDLYGGVAPFAFVATKTITHPLPDHDSLAPEGWSFEFGERVRDVVLPGYSAFALRDARSAGARLLDEGGVRMKKAGGVGGLGQTVACDAQQLDAQLGSMQDDEWRAGLVLERNLLDVTTLSVGLIEIEDLRASYIGRQRLTPNNQGDQVYGGSTLTIVRGGFDELLQIAATPQIRTAVMQARAYHDAAMQSFSGLYASRCNYDIAQGFDDAQHWRSGVLEQSWRVGGASCAEVAALQAFRLDAALNTIRASTTEIYGPSPEVPSGALVYFSGVDEHVGMITKYSLLEPYGNT
jgi:hypothetical protein